MHHILLLPRSITSPSDAVDYLRDATLTLAVFIACYSPAATALLQPDHGALLCTLATAHDRLLPQLARVFSQPSAGSKQLQPPAAGKAGGSTDGEGSMDILAKLGQVSMGLRRLGYLLVMYGLCHATPPGQRREPKPTPQVRASHAAEDQWEEEARAVPHSRRRPRPCSVC